MVQPPSPKAAGALGLGLLGELATCLGFFSRLPVPNAWFGSPAAPPPPLSQAVRMLPVAGLVIGCCGAVPLAAASAAGLPGLLAATLAGAALILATGGLHEDGLADTADGLGGGSTRDRKLAIMRDSRIGSYGVLALVVALLLRFGALAAILDRSGLGAAVAALLAACAVSRAVALMPLALLRPARTEGLGHAAGRPGGSALTFCFGLALAIGLFGPLAGGADADHAVWACAAAAIAGRLVTRLAQSHIGGHTGDIGGAAQQASEAAYLIGLLLFPGHA
jgi:adenosylcobinamide-GDP ribazoletransferase